MIAQILHKINKEDTMTLKEFRLSKGLSQEAFARTIDYTLSMYAKVEQNPSRASRKFMGRCKERYPEMNIMEIFFAK